MSSEMIARAAGNTSMDKVYHEKAVIDYALRISGIQSDVQSGYSGNQAYGTASVQEVSTGGIIYNQANPGVPESSGVEVFLTCTDSTSLTIEKLRRWLRSINVKIYARERLQSMNVNYWVNDVLEQFSSEDGKYILVCVDKNYKEAVCSYKSTEETDDEKKSLNQFIFDQLQTKIIHQGCMNYRYIPVLIDGARFSDVPTIFQSSQVYRWPEKSQELYNRLFRVQTFKAPTLGNVPVPRFESVR